MVFTIIQLQILLAQLNNLNPNQPVQMEDTVNYLIIPFEANTNPVDTQGIKIYLQAKK